MCEAMIVLYGSAAVRLELPDAARSKLLVRWSTGAAQPGRE